MSRQVKPIYQIIVEELKRDLSHYAAGEYLSGEHALARRFGVNRHTVRRALQELEQQGLVARRQGKGTRVLVPDRSSYTLSASTAFSEQMQLQGRKSSVKVLFKQSRNATNDEKMTLQLPDKSEVFVIQTLRLVDNEPASLIRHCYPGEISGLFDDYEGTSLRNYIQDKGYTLKRCSTVIAARLCSGSEASLLQVSEHSAVLSAVTVSCDQNGRPFEISSSITRSDTIQYRITFGH